LPWSVSAAIEVVQVENAHAVEALFSTSYTAKFMVKKGHQAIDYAVMPLEGLWWRTIVRQPMA
jgi:hypothetical protein